MNLISNITFPSSGGSGMLAPFRSAAISIIQWIYSWLPSYGVAIIFFVLLLRLAFLPLDFGTKFFTKRNSMRMAAIKPEEEALKEAYAGDPMGYNRARQQLMKKHGYGMTGFCLFTLLNMVIMMMVFISVFQGLGMISNHNVNQQYIELRQVFRHHSDQYNPYDTVGEFFANRTEFEKWKMTEHFQEEAQQHIDDNSLSYTTIQAFTNSQASFEAWKLTPHFLGEAEIHRFTYVSHLSTIQDFIDCEETAWQSWLESTAYEQFQIDIQRRFDETTVGFLWVVNIWRSDNWSSPTHSWSDFRNAISGVDGRVSYQLNAQGMRALETEYRFIFSHIHTDRNWNGLLLLVVLAGASTFLSSWINMRTMAKKKCAEEEAKKQREKEAGYSIRDVKNQKEGAAANGMPNIDPQVMTGKMMKFMLPSIMIIFTLTTTAALAIYIIAGSIIMTGLTFLVNMAVDKLIAHGEKKKKEAGPDMTIINPHAKYFKSKSGSGKDESKHVKTTGKKVEDA